MIRKESSIIIRRDILNDKPAPTPQKVSHG